MSFDHHLLVRKLFIFIFVVILISETSEGMCVTNVSISLLLSFKIVKVIFASKMLVNCGTRSRRVRTDAKKEKNEEDSKYFFPTNVSFFFVHNLL